MKKILRPRSDPKTERSSGRVTWLLPMIWMEEEEAMRKRGSSRKKLRIPMRQQQQRADGEDDCCRCADAAPTAGGNEPAADRDAAPCAQKGIFFAVFVIAASLLGRPARGAPLRCGLLRYFGARRRWGRGAIELSHRFIRFFTRVHRYTACM